MSQFVIARRIPQLQFYLYIVGVVIFFIIIYCRWVAGIHVWYIDFDLSECRTDCGLQLLRGELPLLNGLKDGGFSDIDITAENHFEVLHF